MAKTTVETNRNRAAILMHGLAFNWPPSSNGSFKEINQQVKTEYRNGRQEGGGRGGKGEGDQYWR